MPDQTIETLVPQKEDQLIDLYRKILESLGRSLATKGGAVHGDTDPHIIDAGCMLVPLTDCMFTALNGNINWNGNLSALTFYTGIPIFGQFTSFTLASGTVLAITI